MSMQLKTINGRLTRFMAVALALAVPAMVGTDIASAEEPAGAAVFKCEGGKTIDATFFGDRVELKLSDGRSMTLPQTMSGSGIRYANGDETFVFWSKGDTAFVTEGSDNKETFADCVSE